MFFSSLFLIGYSKFAPKGLLGRLADADFFQQIRKNLQARNRHVPELALVKIVNRLIEGFKKVECLRRDARLYDAAVVSLAFAGNQAALFHAVKQARHVRVVRNHAVSDATAGQSFGLGPAENAKDIVLSTRKPRGFQEPFCFLAEAVGGLQERHENAVLQGDGEPGGFGAQVHARIIVVITMIVKRKISGIGVSRPA
jgi:hypothetical protein